MSDYPRFQFSVFTKNGRDEQFVIRADNFEEFKELKKQLDTILAKKAQTQASQAATVPIKEGLTATCKTHNVEMAQGWSKTKNKPYWYHRNEANQICFGKEYLK